MNPGYDDIERLKRYGKQHDIFIFKQFRLRDDRSTMRVGTDAMLLGAAVDITGVREALEVGTGCGVIALILAQRCGCRIDALEIDPDSAAQAAENVAGSPWPDRIHVQHVSLQEFMKLSDKKYDLVISNPPFFTRSCKSECSRRNLSRHDDELSFDELLNASSLLLEPHGALWVILPVREGREFRSKAPAHGFSLHHRLLIIPKEGKDPNREILGFSRSPGMPLTEKSLLLRDASGAFHPQYMAFASDFYIDF